jgi:hypothetical protein
VSTYAPTTAVKNTELDTMFQSMYVSLHTGDPGNTGANEVTGGSYIRQLETFGAAASGALSNVTDITFENMPSCTVTYVGFWDADTAGVFKGSAALVSSQDVIAAQNAVFEAAALEVSWP